VSEGSSSVVVQSTERRGRVAAIYARVSSDRQRREQTIQSQTAALRELAAARGLLVTEDLVFEDDGVSGAVLRRPALERLRDIAVEGRFEVLLCHAPDRLARRYAYQVLLLEEFQRTGVEVVFAKEPERSGTPEDELLRQFQGMIAEYERAQIAERCRRGKLHRARAGAVSVLARAPYGYRYVKRSEHADAVFEIDETEAPIAREIFRRYLQEGESIAKIARWLTAQSVPTRTGATGWSNATLWGMLRNPAYAGQAAYGKTHATGAPVRATRQARLRGQRSTRISREGVAPEQWKQIAVPALVTAEQFALVQQRLERNRVISPRNTKRLSLLQGILVCRHCGYAYYRCSTRSKNGKLREYYRCSGTDGHRRPEGRVCENRPVRVAEVDELVWARVLRLLEDPALIQAEIDRRLQTMRAAHPATGRREALKRDLTRARTGLKRLLDGYQEQLITLEELRTRTPELRKREATLQAQLDALDAELHDAETYLKLTETLEGFHARLTANAETLTIQQRQQIIRLVVREVLIGEDDITIRHSIPVPTGDQPPGYLLRSGSRKEPDPGVGPYPAQPADEEGQGRHDDPRLQAPRHHHSVRCVGRSYRHGDRRVPTSPPAHRVLEVPAHDRPGSPQRAPDPSDPGQLLNAQARKREAVAREAPALSSALHADLELLAEPDRAVVRQAHRQGHPPRHLSLSTRTHHRNRDLPTGQQQRPPALHLDRDRRADPRQGTTRTRHTPNNHHLKPRHNTRSEIVSGAPRSLSVSKMTKRSAMSGTSMTTTFTLV
jgi:site-specific DNA recombinase